MSTVSRRRFVKHAVGVAATVRVCVCRKRDDMFRWLLEKGARVVVGGCRRWWWPTAAERIAHRLMRYGHDVVFTDIRPPFEEHRT